VDWARDLEETELDAYSVLPSSTESMTDGQGQRVTAGPLLDSLRLENDQLQTPTHAVNKRSSQTKNLKGQLPNSSLSNHNTKINFKW
jgi:hypothetical protein